MTRLCLEEVMEPREPSPEQSEFLPTRASLLSRLRKTSAGDSWQEFFDLYWKLIYNIARKQGLDDSEAQDVVQETMISVSRAMPNFQYDPERGSFKNWLRTVTEWRIKDQFRKRPRAVALPEGFQTAAPDEFGTIWDKEWEKNLVDGAIARVRSRVTPRMFQVYSFAELQGKGAREASRVLGVTLPTVYLYSHRVKKAIQRELAMLRQREQS